MISPKRFGRCRLAACAKGINRGLMSSFADALRPAVYIYSPCYVDHACRTWPTQNVRFRDLYKLVLWTKYSVANAARICTISEFTKML